MKQKKYESAQIHNSQVLKDFLSLGNPEDLARTENRMLLAVKIQDAMDAKGINKKQLAELLGKAPSMISKWLSGDHNFTIDTLTDMERVLKIKLLAVGTQSPSPKIYQQTVVISMVVNEPSYEKAYKAPSYSNSTVYKPSNLKISEPLCA